MHKHSILIIDSSKRVNNSLNASLQQRGFEVTQAFDIAMAKAILLDHSFDYALLDPDLSDGEGEELLPFLQIHENIRVIVMTTDRDRERREHLFSFGVVIDYITKERNFDDMAFAIVQLIERISTNDDMTILVVDDSSFMRTQLRIMLSTRGFKVLDAVDGKKALDVIATHNIDAAIIDLEMPVMDGSTLLQTIRKDKANFLMPVMVVSGTIDTDKIAKVIKHGAYDFIRKPYSTEELLLKVDKMMQDIKQQRTIKIHEARFAMYNRAIDKAAIFFKLDKHLNIIYANDTLCELLANGVTIQAGSPFEDYVYADDKKHLETLQHEIQKSDTYQRVFRLNSENFDLVTLRLTFTPLRKNDGTIDEILVIGFDISLLQQKETVLQERVEAETKKSWEQNKMLIQQSKMASMGEMIGHIGHQWRQPLNSLGLMFQKLDKAYHKDKLNDELMERSTEKAMRIISQMSKTIDDFRDFFKDDKSMHQCELSGIIQQAQDIIESSLHAQKITLNIHYLQEVSLLCLKNELAQVILNILANAMDALVEHKTEDPQISITLDRKYDEALIIISDNAGGIPEAIIERVFEPYFTTKYDTNGTGIGLYMSKTIIEEHMHGRIGVCNTLSGASFKISLPIIQKDNNE